MERKETSFVFPGAFSILKQHNFIISEMISISYTMLDFF